MRRLVSKPLINIAGIFGHYSLIASTGSARSQAPAWKRMAFEALPRVLRVPNLVLPTVRQAEPAIQCVPRQSLGTR